MSDKSKAPQTPQAAPAETTPLKPAKEPLKVPDFFQDTTRSMPMTGSRTFVKRKS